MTDHERGIPMRLLCAFIAAATLITLAGCGGGRGIPQPNIPTTITTSSGLQYVDLTVGTGTEATDGKTIKVDYTGWLTDGTVFDSSKNEGRTPFEFTLGNGDVIAGWDEGVKGMKIGGTRVLQIPYDLGYGASGKSPSIPGYATLRFRIELLDVTDGTD